MTTKTILVTGGTGFIGAHTCVELLDRYHVVIVDNLSNSKREVVDKIKQIYTTKHNNIKNNKNNTQNNNTENNNLENSNHLEFYEADLLDKEKITRIFKKHKPYAVIHFAGLKSVNDSIKNPGNYYHTNIISTLYLLEIMLQHDCTNLIFSSSATVYGQQKSPLRETAIVGQNITNPYGQTKYMIEQILRDFCIAHKELNIIALRYFNPVGAHPSGLIGENPNDTPNNLMPYVLKVAAANNPQNERLRNFDTKNNNKNNDNNNNINNKQFKELMIFGNDYDTPDGTCQRDFIHVVDLAKGHLAALQKIEELQHFHVFNLGTGTPTSVLEMVEMCKKVNNIDIPFQFAPRREGDIDVCYCDPEYTFNMLGWKTEKTLEDMCII
tara:strand:- start:79 stop:1224 length:1146 start_codon:yes stop_codon:yes gene_type:complete